MRFSRGHQERSRRTFTRLLDATERLLETRAFEEITVQAIAREAGSSVGAFYTRFADKEALRECLVTRYYEDMARMSGESFASAKWEAASLARRLVGYVTAIVRTTRARRGLMRMRFLYDIQSTTPMLPEHRAANEALVARLTAFFAPCRGEIDHPDPDAALIFALRLTDRLVAGSILLSSPRLTAFSDISDDALIEETSRALQRYLGVDDPAPTHRPSKESNDD